MAAHRRNSSDYWARQTYGLGGIGANCNLSQQFDGFGTPPAHHQNNGEPCIPGNLNRALSFDVAGAGPIRQGYHRRVNSTPVNVEVGNESARSKVGVGVLTETQNVPSFVGLGTPRFSGAGVENRAYHNCLVAATGVGLAGIGHASQKKTGGLAGDAAKFHSLGLGRIGVQPTQNIVHLPVPPSAAAGKSAFGGGSPALNGEILKFIMPSGPRKSGEGTEDVHQGIIATMVVNESAILVQLTLLVAGFVIGPSGESVRSLISKTGASIYSYTEVVENKKSRLFYIEGPIPSVVTALQIICAAVTRYKQLAEGQFSGHQVERKQNIYGVDFCYQPPPRSIVPYAAGLKISKDGK
ncbi:hypothetical protein BSKO_05945 [Bryopsis sp. KO-2023]|nr:hypothetical protein BSKO_05945 [Bryopsis sp. KO-2023]